VLYNMLCFWWWSKLMPWPKIEAKLCRLFAERVANGREILRSNNAAATHKTSSIFATPQSLS
jgi:hypothetical protein